MPKILFVSADPKPERWIDAIEREYPEADVIVWKDDGRIHDADYAVVWHPPAALFAQERRLKALFNLGAGVDGLLGLDARPADVPVIRLEDAGMSVQMAEFVIHQVVERTRDMAVYREQQRDREWRIHRPIDRAQWPVGVLGLGQIGARVAKSLAALDYCVAGWVRSERHVDGIEVFGGRTGLQAMLARTRIMINTLPLTDQTRDIMDHAFFSALLPGAVVINVGRGEHVVDQDLLRAIAEGRIAAATLDVFREEPLPPEHAFWRTPQITITPHVSARTLREATIAQIVAKIRSMEAGAPVSGLVDPTRGY